MRGARIVIDDENDHPRGSTVELSGSRQLLCAKANKLGEIREIGSGLEAFWMDFALLPSCEGQKPEA
jgi:hypothetical protein